MQDPRAWSGPRQPLPFWAASQQQHRQITLLSGLKDDTSGIYRRIPIFNSTAYKHFRAKLMENPGHFFSFKTSRLLKEETL